ncbi:TonB family protein [Brevundimonas alba]|uniref:TonB family protein n=1 Tax=Brevundimonas alba TaxID=74314 RepID=A0A7X5YJZ8_9CAUL|nr:TonB family protein [Brevundimonas alba]NJC41173.1 TonB family protein [Brevundimonas alba]
MLSIGLALVAVGQDPQVLNGVIVRPQWVATPTAEQMMPESIRRPEGTDHLPYGEVQLRCVVQAEGRLDECRIVTLSTAYPELGEAALDAARYFRHAPRLENGPPAAGLGVLLKLRWASPAD